MTVAHVYTVAFQGIEAREVDVQVHIGEGGGGVSTSSVWPTRRWRKAASGCARRSSAIGLALPFKRITVNLAPADLPKEGSHYDLPIALGLLAAMGVLPASEMANYVAMGELSLDAQVTAVAGVLPAALAASGTEPRPDLSGRLRAGSGLGGRHRDHRRAVADRARQSHEGRAGADRRRCREAGGRARAPRPTCAT